MQNRYTADVGDFGKFGMLRCLASSGLKIGLNWYLVPDETHNDDGKHTGYLNDSKFSECDDELREKLRKIIFDGYRDVSVLEKAGLIPADSFYSEILYPPKTPDVPDRFSWHAGAIEALKKQDIVFLDPDNGLLVKSVSLGSSKSNKYVLADEIADYYRQGQSVIFYNHRCRQQEDAYLERFRQLQAGELFPASRWAGLKFSRGTIRDYFIIMQEVHAAKIEEAISGLLESNWNRHFNRLPFK
ncbi:MAG: hypothetical protein PHQ50_06475 [Eubacteriales bacterium]|nr:hypothetical protein [Eubacteriales bacterium]